MDTTPPTLPGRSAGRRADRPTLDDYRAAADLRAAVRAFLERGERAAQRAGLTPQRQLLLLMIRGAPDGSGRATMTELADRLRLAQNSVTELVARTEAAGLLTREGSETDGRVVHLRLTAEGERRLEATVSDLRADRHHLVQIPTAQGEVTPDP